MRAEQAAMRVFSPNLHNIAVVILALDLLFIASTSAGLYYLFDALGTAGEEPTLQRVEVIVLLAASCFSMGLYSDCYELPENFLPKVLVAFLITVALALCLSLLSTARALDVRAVVASALLGSACVLVTRFTAAFVAKRERFCRRVLVVGEPAEVGRLQELRRVARTTQFSLIGTGEGLAAGDRPDAERVTRLRRSGWMHEVVLSDQYRLDPEMASALLQCRLEGVRVTVFRDFLERESRKVELSNEEAQRLILTSSARRTRLSRAVKRLIDVVGSLVLLLFTLPLTVLVAVLIKLDDGGPIFYRQMRLGLGNQPFMLTKFRSMRVEGAAGGTSRWASVGDDRVTRVGRLLRRPRIDEIPQLLDVLAGKMSLVGPRPEQVPICRQLEDAIPFYAYRHLVLPGLTGWAQINFPYAASIAEAEEKTRYDLYYLKNGSVILDLVILMQTVRIVLFGQGAR